MLASIRWLRELCELDASVDQIAERLTSAGLEIEGRKRYGDLPGVVVAEVRAKSPHPKKDKLTVVELFDGDGEVTVVCGAPNVPAPGGRVLFARVGAQLPSGIAIGERKLGGVLSRGMICSEQELDMGAESDGIVVLSDETDASPGTSVASALGLADEVLEIGLTPNRPDCLGHLGLARELSALFGVPLRPLKNPRVALGAAPAGVEGMRPVALHMHAAEKGSVDAVPAQVEDPARCPRYALCTVEGITVAASPFWLRYRLHVLGLRAINNVVDATNLVLLEYGYPTHAFDSARLEGSRIVVRVARAGETIRTLDGLEHTLSEDDLTICDAERPIAVAGVMGGEDSSVTNTTRNVAIECAYFDPRGVRRTARRLGLHTDSSHRFERGVDIRAVSAVLARTAALVAQLAGGVASAHGFEIYPEPVRERVVSLRLARIEQLLGVAPPEGAAASILSSLGCAVEQSGTTLRVRVPTWRPDLAIEEDLIEEVARVWGYQHIPTVVPSILARSGTEPLTRLVRRLKQQAAAVGLTEVINYAFVAEFQLPRARLQHRTVSLLNPLSEERGVMRPSLLIGLCANLLRAQRHQVPRMGAFELARTFRTCDDVLPEQRYKLGLLLWGPREEWFGEPPAYDFYDGKGYLESVLAPVVGTAVTTVCDEALLQSHPYLHPRRAARVRLGERDVGVLGELHPDVLDDLELAGPVVFAEIDVADVLSAERGEAPTLKPLPRFPASTRDLAVVLEEAVEAGQVVSTLKDAGGDLVEGVQLFDLYRGEQVGAGKKSLAFRICYRSPDATLTDAQVDAAHAKLVARAHKTLGAEVRS